MYKLICMSFDGEYQTETNRGELFETVEDAWRYSGDMGSRWFFYPFHFVVTESGLTIREAPDRMEQFNGIRVKTMQKIFNDACQLPDLENADCEDFLRYLVWGDLPS